MPAHDRHHDQLVLVELTRELDGDPPGTRWALAKIIADSLIAAGAATVVGGEAAAKTHLRKSQRPDPGGRAA